ncbi:amidohydrolase family protein [Edaphobacter flagellatus]|uniref:amidohydrolase family protein n=1 Tax=Edaphobacter flagellatus TaxID=1933044 RepID=UPI0021B1BC55|nr:amidohydrolase family protein [Edaphobacter flagellatus]
MRIIASAMIFSAAIAASAQQQPIILHNAALVDGTGATARQHVDITMHKGRIESVRPAFKQAPSRVEIVDCTGKTVIPALISAHSHLGILLNNADPSPDAYTTENVTAALNQFERYGVTTIVSLGLNRDLVYELREQQRAGKLEGATILTAGRGIGVPNGAPGLNVAPDQVYRPATPEEARKDVNELASHHADLVKLWLDSGHGKIPAMSPAIYTAIIEEAHKHHLKVAAHVYTLDDARSLVNANVDILAHSVRDQAIDAAFAQSLIQHKVWYIPTLALDEAFYLYAASPEVMQSAFFKQAAGPQLLAKLTATDYAEKTLAAPQTEQAKKDHVIAMKNLKMLSDAGVSIAFGTDSGAVTGRIPGFSEHRELEDLVEAGITPLQAISLATGESGRLIHELNPHLNVGLVKEDYSADLIILSADPLMDIRNTRRIDAVYHHGVLVPNTPPKN